MWAQHWLDASNSAGERGVTNAPRREQISAGTCIFLTSNKSSQRKVGINSSAFQAASCLPCVLQKYLSCMTLSWHLPWCKGKGHPCFLWPELGSSHHGKILITYRSPCTKLALGFHCYQLEGREEELKCNAMRGIFRLMIDAPAVKGRWQSAEQHLGVNSKWRREIRFLLRCRCTRLAIPRFPFSFLSRQHISFPLCVFF